MSPAARTTEAEHGAYWTAVSEGDEAAAHAVAAAAVARGVGVEDVLGLVTAAQLRVGELWADNDLSVAQEHAATAVSEAVVRRLTEQTVEPAEGSVVLVACVEREWHALPALVLAQVLRGHGLRVDYLGANASRDGLVNSIVDLGPRAVLLSASLTSSLFRVRRQVETVRGTGTPVVVGGRAFDPQGVRARRLGATAYAATPADLVALLPTLPRHVAFAPALRHPAAAEARSLQASAEELSRDVDRTLRATLGLSPDALGADPDDWRVVLTGFVPHVVDCVTGALLTEDPTVVAETHEWLRRVLAGRGAPPDAVAALWQALRQALHDYPEALGILADPAS